MKFVASNPSVTELKTHRVEDLMHVKPVETRNPPYGVVWKFKEEVPAQVSTSLLDRGSKLRRQTPIAHVAP
ncbi:hypothetical protein TNCV_1763841 [Trichonephila clavipes]|nr:hypothetical protein TNCV_1763841 [Trichonephila clavipes]